MYNEYMYPQQILGERIIIKLKSQLAGVFAERDFIQAHVYMLLNHDPILITFPADLDIVFKSAV